MGVGIARIDHEGYALQAGHCLFQERHALTGEIAMHQREAGHVTARTSEALNQLGGDGSAASTNTTGVARVIRFNAAAPRMFTATIRSVLLSTRSFANCSNHSMRSAG